MFQLTSIDGNFQLNGEEVFLRTGEFHYFRVDPEFWERDLRVLKEEGLLNVISTYVPWIFHELSKGDFDFDGRTHPRRNLKLFLDICRRLSLPVIFRPGPFIYSEYLGFGIPLWVGEQYPEVVVRTADGSFDRNSWYYNISLNHPIYLSLVRAWYQKLSEEFADYFDDPIICFQLDNETGLMYNFNVGRIDFNEQTITTFHEWLTEAFGSPEVLSVFCYESFLSFDEVLPPTDGLNVTKSMIWQSFLEDLVVRFLENLKGMAIDFGVPVLFAINEQGNFFNPSNPAKKAPLAEIYGYNLSLKTSYSKATLDVPFGNSIIPSIFKAYLQPEFQALFASEMGCGWFDPRTVVSNESTVQSMLASIAHGAKGICLYVVRDGADIRGNRYEYQSMLDSAGNKLPRFSAVQSVYQFVASLGEELVNSEEIYDEIAFAAYALNHRTLPSDFDSSGRVINPLKIITLFADYGVFGLLLASGYNPAPISLENISLKAMRRFKTIFFHSRGAIIRDDYKKLLEYVKGGGHLITGPDYPVMDEYGVPFDSSKLYPAIVSNQKVYGSKANVLKLINSATKFAFQKERLRKYNKYSLYHIEQTEYLNNLRSWSPKGPYARTENGKKLKIDYLSREFKWQKEGVESVLTVKGKPIGYRYTYRKGTNTVIGTPLGARYVTEAFYKDSQKVKKENKAFIEELLAKNNVQKTFDSDVEIEIVCRFNKKKRSLLVFLLNRGGKKEGIFKVLIPAKTRLPANKRLQIEKIYSCLESEVFTNETSLDELTFEGLRFKVEKDDSLVLRISPKSEEE